MYPSVGKQPLSSLITGLYPIYKSSTDIEIAPGLILFNGDQYFLDNQITLSSVDVTSGWHFIYLNANPSSSQLTVSDFFVSDEIPSRNIDGWYNSSNNRCIGWYYSNGSEIFQFRVSGNVYCYEPRPLVILNASGGTSGTYYYGYYGLNCSPLPRQHTVMSYELQANGSYYTAQVLFKGMVFSANLTKENVAVYGVSPRMTIKGQTEVISGSTHGDDRSIDIQILVSDQGHTFVVSLNSHTIPNGFGLN